MKSESDGNVGESNPYTITEEYLTEQLKKENSGRYSTQIYATITGNFFVLLLHKYGFCFFF